MYDIPIQLNWLENSILEYEQEPVQTGKILFYGHSLFTRWGHPKYGYRRLDEDIRMKDGSLACVNHGFGTSTSEELLYYYPRMVRPWAPKALVISSLSNDMMYGYSVEEVMANIARLCHWARTDFPGIRLFLVERHPCPADREQTLPDKWVARYHQTRKYNELLALYAQTHKDTQLITLWDRPELFETPEDVGNPHKIRTDIFVEDKVHPNQAGYDLLGPIFRAALDDVL